VSKLFFVLFCSFFTLCGGVLHAEELTLDLVKQKVIAAGKLIEQEGAAAIPKIQDEKGEFRFANGEGYIWIHDLDGVMVMHPIKPSLDGKSIIDIRDTNGFHLFLAMNELVEKKGAGWVAYHWPKPGEQTSSPKVSYVTLVKKDGKNYVVGCGMNGATKVDIKTKYPNDPLYEE